jgi:hypothetical protein
MLACASCAGSPTRNRDYASRQSLRTAPRCQNMLAPDRNYQHGAPCLPWRLLGKSQRLQRILLQRAPDSNRRSSRPLREFPSACHALRLLTPTCTATPRLNSLCPAIETRLPCILQSLWGFKNSLAPDRQTPLQDADAWTLACASCAGSPTRNRDYAFRQSLRAASRCQNMLAPDRNYQHGAPCLPWRLLGKSQRLQRILLQPTFDSNRRSSMPLREFPSACHALRLLTPTCATAPRLNSLCPAIETRLPCILQSLWGFKNSLAPDRQTPLQDQDAWMLACTSCAGSPTRNRDYASRPSLRTASRCQDMLAPDRKYQHGAPCLPWRLLGNSQRLQHILLQRTFHSNRRSSMPLREFPSACHALRSLTPTCTATPRLNSLCPAIETRLPCILRSLWGFKNFLAPDRQTPLQDQDAWTLACTPAQEVLRGTAITLPDNLSGPPLSARIC